MLQARLVISGRVQGVGYRDWAIETGRRLGLAGWVRNRRDGAVEALIVGEEGAVGQMIEACRRGPSLAHVEEIDVDPVDLDILP
ncbi:MAG TPA: acylphosphatase, partial [Reyranella sp.]